jgi:hypothetical protein
MTDVFYVTVIAPLKVEFLDRGKNGRAIASSRKDPISYRPTICSHGDKLPAIFISKNIWLETSSHRFKSFCARRRLAAESQARCYCSRPGLIAIAFV